LSGRAGAEGLPFHRRLTHAQTKSFHIISLFPCLRSAAVLLYTWKESREKSGRLPAKSLRCCGNVSKQEIQMHCLRPGSGRARKRDALTETGSLAHLGTVITEIHRKHLERSSEIGGVFQK